MPTNVFTWLWIAWRTRKSLVQRLQRPRQSIAWSCWKLNMISNGLQSSYNWRMEAWEMAKEGRDALLCLVGLDAAAVEQCNSISCNISKEIWKPLFYYADDCSEYYVPFRSFTLARFGFPGNCHDSRTTLSICPCVSNLWRRCWIENHTKKGMNPTLIKGHSAFAFQHWRSTRKTNLWVYLCRIWEPRIRYISNWTALLYLQI